MSKLRVSAIHYLNPAPLMYDFEHPPERESFLERFDVHYTAPSQCARELGAGTADLGLIPIAALAEHPELLVVPELVIASPDVVRSILILSKVPLEEIRSLAADTSSRSSVAYAHILFQHFLGIQPEFHLHPPSPTGMLHTADAALIIGDAALLARKHQDEIETKLGQTLYWCDLAHEWHTRTGLPWVAAVWAVRPEAIPDAPGLVADLVASRDHGIANVDRIVEEWAPRIGLTKPDVHEYLTKNIHYTLTPECLTTIGEFHRIAARLGVLPKAPTLKLLT